MLPDTGKRKLDLLFVVDPLGTQQPEISNVIVECMKNLLKLESYFDLTSGFRLRLMARTSRGDTYSRPEVIEDFQELSFDTKGLADHLESLNATRRGTSAISVALESIREPGLWKDDAKKFVVFFAARPAEGLANQIDVANDIAWKHFRTKNGADKGKKLADASRMLLKNDVNLLLISCPPMKTSTDSRITSYHLQSSWPGHVDTFTLPRTDDTMKLLTTFIFGFILERSSRGGTLLFSYGLKSVQSSPDLPIGPETAIKGKNSDGQLRRPATGQGLRPNIHGAGDARHHSFPYEFRDTLGSGPYATVREVVHKSTNKHYACKVIKKSLEDKVYKAKNEVEILKHLSGSHRNIITWHYYFETVNEHLLVFELCQGERLSDRMRSREHYREREVVKLIRKVMHAVEHVHSYGIVHRDINPENLLFRDKAEGSDIILAGFSFSKFITEDASLMDDVHDDLEYLAPEMLTQAGHGKPVDIWAGGVLTYFLLCGHNPFKRKTKAQTMMAICKGEYEFEPKYWNAISRLAQKFIAFCLVMDPNKRPTAKDVLAHDWLAQASEEDIIEIPHTVVPLAKANDGQEAKRIFRKIVLGIMAVNRFSEKPVVTVKKLVTNDLPPLSPLLTIDPIHKGYASSPIRERPALPPPPKKNMSFRKLVHGIMAAHRFSGAAKPQ